MFKIEYQYTCKDKNGNVSEGGFSALRRLFGSLVLGEEFTKMGE